ncbi:MAG: hypothetical protein IPP73_18900 [Chitinophagaceae bacterium]|nr:hypothetical protein [Chitinophagaceae bacterium]
MESISNNCKPDVLVLVETTVPPGTSEKNCKTHIGRMPFQKRIIN